MKSFNEELWTISDRQPATARVLVWRDISGQLHLRSTVDEKETIDILDGAMESIDGQRFPPNGD